MAKKSEPKLPSFSFSVVRARWWRSLGGFPMMRGEVPRYRGAYDQLDAWFKARQDPWHFQSDNYECERLRKTVEVAGRLPHASILEVGCAEGDMTRLLCDVSPDVTALEVSPTAAERVRAAAPRACVVQGSLEEFRPGRRFQLAVCAETLYYVADVAAALRRLNDLADQVLVTYTKCERERLDPLFDPIPALIREKFSYLRVFDSGRLVNWRGFRIVAWKSPSSS